MLVDKIAGRAWAIRAEVAAHIHGLIAKDGFAALRDLAELKHEIHMTDAAQAARGVARQQRSSTVAVIPIIGTLTQREEFLASASTRSTADISLEARAASMDPAVDAILLEVDSPGGEVAGTPEAWAGIREAGKNKPVIAAVNSQAGSAAYYLASAAEEIWVTPSGVVGSVGVYMLHKDRSKNIEESGEAWEFVVAADSPFKTEGNPTGPLSDEARRDIQGHVDRFMGLFIRDLARGRAVGKDQVRKSFGGGRMLGPSDAVEAGMVDQIGTVETALQRAATLGRDWRERRESAAARAAQDGPTPTAGPPDPPIASPEPVTEPEPPLPKGPDPDEEARIAASARDLARRLRDSV